MSAVLRDWPTPEENVEDWACFHLSRAAQSRARLERMVRGTVDYGAEHYQRFCMLEQAKKHIATLRGVGYPLSAELCRLMASEGLE